MNLNGHLAHKEQRWRFLWRGVCDECSWRTHWMLNKNKIIILTWDHIETTFSTRRYE